MVGDEMALGIDDIAKPVPRLSSRRRRRRQLGEVASLAKPSPLEMGSTSVDDPPEPNQNILLFAGHQQPRNTTAAHAPLAITLRTHTSRGFPRSLVDELPSFATARSNSHLPAYFRPCSISSGGGGGVESSCCDFAISQAPKKPESQTRSQPVQLTSTARRCLA